MPGCRRAIRNWPPLSVLAVLSLFVPMLRAVALALGTTAPWGSVTVPATAPSVLDWARSSKLKAVNANNATNIWKKRLGVKLVITGLLNRPLDMGFWEVSRRH